jgi:sigma-E factor negative regulatory protein RseB
MSVNHVYRLPRRARQMAVWMVLGLAAQGAWAQSAPAATGPEAARPAAKTERDIGEWLNRLHEASRRRAYVGTFVVTVGSEMAASKIWHVCDGTRQVERIETLTGTPRTTLRMNDEVMTFEPDSKTVWVEKREAFRLFPDFLNTPANHIADHYVARSIKTDRVAGFEADVVDFAPKDQHRFGYRIWSERKTGLVIKLQTLDAASQVLEQVAFTELQLNAPLSVNTLALHMTQTAGYQVQPLVTHKTTPEQQGWSLKSDVLGFTPAHCQSRDGPAQGNNGALQCIYTDGLASVSLFVETYDPQKHAKEKSLSSGATHSIAQRVGKHWVTAMGEAPPATLRKLAAAVQSRP